MYKEGLRMDERRAGATLKAGCAVMRKVKRKKVGAVLTRGELTDAMIYRSVKRGRERMVSTKRLLCAQKRNGSSCVEDYRE